MMGNKCNEKHYPQNRIPGILDIYCELMHCLKAVRWMNLKNWMDRDRLACCNRALAFPPQDQGGPLHGLHRLQT